MIRHSRDTVVLLLAAVLLFAAALHYGGTGIAAAYLAALNGALFLLYGLDKAAARRGWRRTPEVLLHLAALAGGTAGALLAQRLFRHKVAKRSFMVRFWGIALLQTAAALLWITGLLPPLIAL